MLTKLFPTRGFATKMMAGSTSNSKDSAGRRLGIKKFGQAEVLENEIIARQRGYQWHPGNHVHSGKDHTLHSTVEVLIIHCYLIGYPWMEQRPLLGHKENIHSCHSPGDTQS